MMTCEKNVFHEKCTHIFLEHIVNELRKQALVLINGFAFNPALQLTASQLIKTESLNVRKKNLVCETSH